MQELNKTDMHFILSRTPRDVRELLQKHRLFLAGGFIRGTIAGEPISDIDLLGPDKDMLNLCSLEVATSRKGRVHTTDNALTVIAPPRAPIQFITRWLYDDPEALIMEFDFTIVQAAIWWEPASNEFDNEIGLGKWRSVCSDAFYPDLAARRLVYTSPIRHEDAGGSILRAIKYIKRGYNIQAPSLATVVARFISGLRLSNNRDMANADGHLSTIIVDGVEIINEKWAAPLLLSLLREVDPLTIIDGIEPIEDEK